MSVKFRLKRNVHGRGRYLHGMLSDFQSIAFVGSCEHRNALHERKIALRHSGDFESLRWTKEA